MKRSALILIIIFSITFISLTLNDDDPKKLLNNINPSNNFATVDNKQMDGNAISTWYRTNGSFNRNPTTQNA
ncbi:MAG: hypothetical protein ABI792_00300, partial [bacterium]